jgi:hypothetical protein
MTAEQQRIAIAEACGWKRIRKTSFGLMGNRPEDDLSLTSDDYLMVCPLPDYLNDLNSMHEAEQEILGNWADFSSRWHTYEQELKRLCGLRRHWLSATVSQRAEAFLKTLNLWNQ